MFELEAFKKHAVSAILPSLRVFSYPLKNISLNKSSY